VAIRPASARASLRAFDTEAPQPPLLLTADAIVLTTARVPLADAVNGEGILQCTTHWQPNSHVVLATRSSCLISTMM
jgi:hypothetical protein